MRYIAGCMFLHILLHNGKLSRRRAFEAVKAHFRLCYPILNVIYEHMYTYIK